MAEEKEKKPAKSKDETPKAEKAEKKPAAKAGDAEKSTAQAPATSEAPKKAKKPVEAKKEGAAAPPENLSLDADVVEAPKIVKAKGAKHIHSGIAHVYATFNNTIVTITDQTGNVIGWSSAGKVGFKGSRKSTAYAAQLVAQDAARQAMGHGLKEVQVLVKGPGAGRESAVRALQAIGLDLNLIRDVTPVPHNGCRPPKQRRV